MIAQRFRPLGYQQITAAMASSAASLTPPAGATVAMLQAEGQNVRFRDDGQAPTATVGMLLVSGASPLEYSGTLSALQVIAATSGAILNVSYYSISG